MDADLSRFSAEFNKGYRAFENGSLRRNPYLPLSQRYVDWSDGWYAAENDLDNQRAASEDGMIPGDFRTSMNSIVPREVMRRISARLRAGDNEDFVCMNELPDHLPESDVMKDEVREVMEAARRPEYVVSA